MHDEILCCPRPNATDRIQTYDNIVTTVEWAWKYSPCRKL